MSRPSLEEMAVSIENTFVNSLDSFNESTECYFQWLDEKVPEAKLMMAEDVVFAVPKTPGKRKRVARRPAVPSINEIGILSSEDNSLVQSTMDDEGVLKTAKGNLRSAQQPLRRITLQSRPRNENDSVDYDGESESDGMHMRESQTSKRTNKSRQAKRSNSRAVSKKMIRTTRASTRQSKLQRTLDSSYDVANDEDPVKLQSPKPLAVDDKPDTCPSEGTEKPNHRDTFVLNKNLDDTYVVAKSHTQPSFNVSDTTAVIAGSSVPSYITPEKTFLASPGRAINNETFVKPRIAEEGRNTDLLKNVDHSNSKKFLNLAIENKSKNVWSPRSVVSSYGKSPSVKSYVRAYERLHINSPTPKRCSVVLSPLKESSVHKLADNTRDILRSAENADLEHESICKKLKLAESEDVPVSDGICSDSKVMAKKSERLQVNTSPENSNAVSNKASASVSTPSNGNKTFTLPDRDIPFTNPIAVPLDNDDCVIPSPIEDQKRLHSKKKLAHSHSHSSLSKKRDAAIPRLLRSSQKAHTPLDWSKKKHTRSNTASESQTKFMTKSSSLGRLNNISTARTFLNPSTLVKPPIAEEIEAKRLEEFKIRQKKAEETLKKKEELDKKKRELAKKTREIRLERVKENKKEKEAESLKLKQQLESVQQNLTKKEREREERLKDDQAKRQMKNRLKLEEAEARRKLDEEARQAKLREQEFIQKENENKLNRRRELEEQERKQKLAESRLLQEERAAQAEKEKARLLQQRHQEQEIKEQEMKQKKVKLEKLKGKEKIAREKAELEKAFHKEKLMREQLEKERGKQARELLEEKHRQQEAQTKGKADAIQKPITIDTLSKEKEAIPNKTVNVTYCKASESSGSDTYEMTPDRVKVTQNANPDNYGIDDLKSGDETDEETDPRKRIPEWASGCKLKAALIQQEYMPPDLEEVFGLMIAPDLAQIFNQHRKRFFKRTSSAIWNSPVLL